MKGVQIDVSFFPSFAHRPFSPLLALFAQDSAVSPANRTMTSSRCVLSTGVPHDLSTQNILTQPHLAFSSKTVKGKGLLLEGFMLSSNCDER